MVFKSTVSTKLSVSVTVWPEAPNTHMNEAPHSSPVVSVNADSLRYYEEESEGEQRFADIPLCATKVISLTNGLG